MLDRCVVKMASCTAGEHCCAEKLGLFLHQEKLLRPQNTARASNSDPTYELLSRDLIVFHSIKSDQSACTSKTRLAMDSNSSWIRLGEMSFANVQEIIHNIFWRV